MRPVGGRAEIRFSTCLPVGRGLFAVRAVEAAAPAETIGRDYGRHFRAARESAVAHLGDQKMSGWLLDQVGLQQTLLECWLLAASQDHAIDGALP
jgi:hypothetical protein